MTHRINKHTEQSGNTRERLIQAAVDLFIEENLQADPFRDLNLTEVAARAGLTRNGLLYHWPTKQKFCDEVMARLLAGSVENDLGLGSLRTAAESTASGHVIEDLFRVAALDLAALAENHFWHAVEVASVTYATKRPDLQDLARAGYRALDNATWAEVYGILSDRAGREPRPPFDGRSIGAVLQAFVEGAGIRQLLDPEVLRDPIGSGQHGAFALSVATLVSIMTRPNDGSDDRDVETVLRDLIDPKRSDNTVDPSSGHLDVGGVTMITDTTEGPVRIETANSVWVFDPDRRRFLRIPRGLDVTAPQTIRLWQPYFKVERDPDSGAFAVWLDEEGSRLLHCAPLDAWDPNRAAIDQTEAIDRL